jgi:hypothetical protein
MFRTTWLKPPQIRNVFPGMLLCLGLFPVMATADLSTNLFIQDRPLKMDLFLNQQDLCRKKDRSVCQDATASLSYSLDGQQYLNLPVKVRTRGTWRLRRDVCTIPPLFLVFPEEQPAESLFAGQDLLPLTTHCSNRDERHDDYVLKEYLAYRIYQLFSKKSVRVRLAYIRYRKQPEDKPPRSNYSFFSEHFLSVAARTGTELWKTSSFKPTQSDPMEMATMELFQYMIGNTDFSALAQHNIVLLRAPDGQVTPLPYDFDFSGLVNASYAGPLPKLRLRSVRQRLYRGFCHPGLDWDALFQQFRDKRMDVFELLESTPGLSKSAQKSTLRYLKKFYEILDSPKKRQKKIVDYCR